MANYSNWQKLIDEIEKFCGVEKALKRFPEIRFVKLPEGGYLFKKADDYLLLNELSGVWTFRLAEDFEPDYLANEFKKLEV